MLSYPRLGRGPNPIPARVFARRLPDGKAGTGRPDLAGAKAPSSVPPQIPTAHDSQRLPIFSPVTPKDNMPACPCPTAGGGRQVGVCGVGCIKGWRKDREASETG
jgi:hypothetical protein